MTRAPDRALARALRVRMVSRVAVAEGDGLGWAAMALDVAALGVVAIAFIPDLFQEVATIMLIISVGLIMFVFAVILAIKTKRQEGHHPWVASAALVLGLLPPCWGCGWSGSRSIACPVVTAGGQVDPIRPIGTRREPRPANPPTSRWNL